MTDADAVLLSARRLAGIAEALDAEASRLDGLAGATGATWRSDAGSGAAERVGALAGWIRQDCRRTLRAARVLAGYGQLLLAAGPNGAVPAGESARVARALARLLPASSTVDDDPVDLAAAVHRECARWDRHAEYTGSNPDGPPRPGLRLPGLPGGAEYTGSDPDGPPRQGLRLPADG